MIVFAFLVILPTGEHFHIVTALPALFFRRGGPTNRVPSLDLEKIMGDDVDEAAMRIGVDTARDLTWKEGLDVFTCTECGRCKDACPTFLTGKPLAHEVGPRQPQAPSARGARGDRRTEGRRTRCRSSFPT